MLGKASMVVSYKGNLRYPKSIQEQGHKNQSRTQESKQNTRIKAGLCCFFKVKINCRIQL